jgi:hypothetical protein
VKQVPEHTLVTKASGELHPFSEEKLLRSLMRSGAEQPVAEEIIQTLKPRIFPGVPTHKIYTWAFALLRSRSRPLAAKYQLKTAIMQLGPSGFPFEKYVAAVLSHQGYRTQVGTIVPGKCVDHEIDVIAEKDGRHFMIECKYHNHRGIFTEVKVPLYIQARFKDVEIPRVKLPGSVAKFDQGWVVTNTRFSADALKYGMCAGLKLIGWDHPNGESLRSQVDRLNLYPVTCLTTLSAREKRALLERKIVLCKEIGENANVLRQIGIKEVKMRSVLDEARQLCEFPGQPENQ